MNKRVRLSIPNSAPSAAGGVVAQTISARMAPSGRGREAAPKPMLLLAAAATMPATLKHRQDSISPHPRTGAVNLCKLTAIPKFGTDIGRGWAVGKNTSFSIGDHFSEFVAVQVEQGRYSSASDVVRAALRLLEEQEVKLAALRAALVEGEQSGPSIPFDFEAFVAQKRSA